jgi:hypothetical protein
MIADFLASRRDSRHFPVKLFMLSGPTVLE